MASHFFQSMVADVFVHSSVVMGMFIQGMASCLPSGDYWEYSFALKQGMTIYLPNGDYQLTTYSWLVMSFIVGPVGEASGSGPLMGTLPMEVVMVSTYVMPVTSSFMLLLVLTLEIPGVTTSPMGMVPMGASRSTSTSSGICKQAVTLEKPCSRVGSHMSTNACGSKEGLGGVGVLGGQDGGFMGIIWESWLDPTFGLEVLVSWGISLVATTGWDGCSTFSHPRNFGGSLFQSWLQCTVCLGDVCSEKGLWTLLLFLLGEGHPQKNSSLVKERYHFTSSLSSNMLSTNNCGPPPAGGLFCSAQCWRALAYTTTFSLGISLMSLQA